MLDWLDRLLLWLSDWWLDRPMAPRSPAWPRVRATHLALHPCCAACGSRRKLEVHHVEPVHLAPARELDPTNLMTLCRRCHKLVGHLDSWTSYNPDAPEDADALCAKIRRRPGRPA